MLILLPQWEGLYRDAVLGGVGVCQLRDEALFIRIGREGGFFPWEKFIPKIKLVVFPRLEDFFAHGAEESYRTAATDSAQRRPSSAAETMPPAKPAPSPQG